MMSLEDFAKKELKKHKRIMIIVKEYIDNVLKEMGIGKIDNSTYFAMIMELTRSIFINYSYEQRSKKYFKK